MCRSKAVKIFCIVIMLAVAAAAAVLIISALHRAPIAVSEPPAASPSPAEPEPTPASTPAPEITPPPESAEPPYDIWSDPNVLWGEGRTDDGYFAGTWGEIKSVSTRLGALIESAEEEQLIGFYVMRYENESDPFELDIDKLLIYHKLDPDGKLTELLKEYCAESQAEYIYREIQEHLRELRGDTMAQYTGPYESHRGMFESRWLTTSLEWERDQIILDIANRLMNEWQVLRFPETDEEWAEWQENWNEANRQAKEIALKDEWYQKTVELSIYYSFMNDMEQIFWDSWSRQEAEYIRERLVELGFTPANEMEKFLRRYDPYAALAFVGNAEQFRQLEDSLQEGELIRLGVIPKEWAHASD